MPKKFFEQRSEESRIKAQIVDKYYRAWAKIIAPRARDGKIAYVDLFAGPGRYKDGAASVPLLVLENAILDPLLKDRLITIFNDIDENNSKTLEEEIAKIPGIDTLRFKPQVMNEIVGQQIINQLTAGSIVPTLSFIDPWGYKGLSLKLINTFLKDWGCDCIFFFNYNRINMGLNNPIVKEHMDALFGSERANALREEMGSLDPAKRELLIVERISEALQEMGGTYVLPFCFKNEQGTRTSHYLIFVSKHILGYKIMKGIMGGESSKTEQNVPSFSYCSADNTMPLLFELSKPLDELEGILLEEFAGRTLTMKALFDSHHVGRRYLDKNYKEALGSLEMKGKLKVDPPTDKRRKGTFADGVKVTFPPKEKEK
ncbi:three-Cys-motif partner protein TcmP [Mesorhizobium sp.]|uniref:three-Cys-motif partner protein TcmP n=1 Tax=Mesorhizobium sp. TaxID=1871066 RepID=UPI000FE8BBFE|nr:three-Cys-motif partner protein TcmP [Mesorhizobium sp.]RWP48984.1 MAG: three-Cys-motif partner protein TcmP [Mesorhizobium sp.]